MKKQRLKHEIRDRDGMRLWRGEAYDMKEAVHEAMDIRGDIEHAVLSHSIISGTYLPLSNNLVLGDADGYMTYSNYHTQNENKLVVQWLKYFKQEGGIQMSGKVHKENVIKELPTAEQHARITQHAQNREEFWGNGIEGHWRRHWNCDMDDDNFQMYGVYVERVTFPIFIYDEVADVWCENTDTLGEQCDEYKRLAKPALPEGQETIKMNTDDILLVANGGMAELITKANDSNTKDEED